MDEDNITKSVLFAKLGPFLKCMCMDSDSGNTVPNQFVCYFENGSVFQSYETIVAAFVGGRLYMNDRYRNYSTTTNKYCNRYTDMNASERMKGINNGTIKLFES